MNKAQLIGNLGADPEMRNTASGTAVANLRIATTERWNDRNGQRQEQTEWHRVIFFGRLAEVCGECLSKGSKVYIEGRIQTRKWTDQAGNDRYTTEIVARNMEMLGGGAQRQEERSGYGYQTGGGAPPGQGRADDLDDDVPF